jgi:hypothetical protein
MNIVDLDPEWHAFRASRRTSGGPAWRVRCGYRSSPSPDVRGYCDDSRRVIRISPGLTGNELDVMIVHESVHAVAGAWSRPAVCRAPAPGGRCGARSQPGHPGRGAAHRGGRLREHASDASP